MKKFLLLIPFLLLCAFAHAQGFSWQGVVKEANGNAVTQPVTLQFTILKNGAFFYSETHLPKTPIAGQLTATVGSVNTNTFGALVWSNDNFSLEVKMTVSGVTISSSSAMLPVPFALYALNSGGWSQNGNNSFKLDGNIGLGMNDPATKLQMLGDIWLQGSRKLYFQGGPADPNYMIESFVVPGSAALRVKGHGGVFLATNTGDKVDVHDEAVYFHAPIIADGQIYSSTIWPAYHWKRQDGAFHYSMDLSPSSGNLTIYDQIQQKSRLEIRPNGIVSVPILEIRGGADIIEKTQSSEKTNPLQAGEVVIVDENNPQSALRSTKSYQKTVIGVVSGAGGISHGLSLQQEGVLEGDTPIAVAGRVKVMVIGKVKPGDLLTTSTQAGKAMKAKNFFRKNGAIIGKALSKPDKNGLVLMLVNIQ
jgi:hypothetical protein